MKTITVSAALLFVAIPGFGQTPHRGLSSLFNSKLAYYLPSPDTPPVSVSVVTTSSNTATIAPNTWIEIHGTNLSQVIDTWNNSDFSQGLPTTLDGVSATVNGKSGAIYYVSPSQVNVLAPIDSAAGPVQVILKTSAGTAPALTINEQAMSLAFLIIDQPNHHVAAVNYPSGIIVAPAGEFPGLTTLPAAPGAVVELYATGFGQPATPITAQPTGQVSLSLPAFPQITIGNLPAQVSFAGMTGPGLYQFNVTVPQSAPNGDLPIVATYNGNSTQAGAVIAIHN